MTNIVHSKVFYDENNDYGDDGGDSDDGGDIDDDDDYDDGDAANDDREPIDDNIQPLFQIFTSFLIDLPDKLMMMMMTMMMMMIMMMMMMMMMMKKMMMMMKLNLYARDDCVCFELVISVSVGVEVGIEVEFEIQKVFLLKLHVFLGLSDRGVKNSRDLYQLTDCKSICLRFSSGSSI